MTILLKIELRLKTNIQSGSIKIIQLEHAGETGAEMNLPMLLGKLYYADLADHDQLLGFLTDQRGLLFHVIALTRGNDTREHTENVRWDPSNLDGRITLRLATDADIADIIKSWGNPLTLANWIRNLELKVFLNEDELQRIKRLAAVRL